MLSLILHRKAGSSDVLDTIHRLRRGVYYTEWDQNQNSHIPDNITKGIFTTVVADNIDWKNKSLSGKETHNTNCILIQHDAYSESSGSKVNVEPDYNYDKKKHRSFKGEPSVLPTYYFKKTNCENFVLNDSNEIIKSTENSVQSSFKTIFWILCGREKELDDLIPAWSAFQSKTSSKPTLCEGNIRNTTLQITL